MNKSVLAAQCFTVRKHTQTAHDLQETMLKIKKIGYNAVQLSAIGPIDPVTVKNATDNAGLTIRCTHIKYDRFKKDLDNVIAEHKIFGCKHVGLGKPPVEYTESAEGYIRFAKEFNAIGKELNDAGFRFMYHNHSFELQKFGGKTGLQILIEESDPEYFDFEMDTYWLQNGGSDPVEWIRKVKNRMKVVHFKDAIADATGEHLTDAEIGEGNLDWSKIFEACKYTGVEWHAVELDIKEWEKPFEALELSLRNLNKMGIY